jgi:hypothetical protein
VAKGTYFSPVHIEQLAIYLPTPSTHMTMRNSTRYIHASAWVLLLSALFACGDRSGPNSSESLAAGQQEQKEKDGIVSITSYRPQVPEKEYLCMISDHQTYVRNDINNNQLHPDRIDTLSINEIENGLPTADPKKNYSRGLEFYYGLEAGSRRLVLAVQFVKLFHHSTDPNTGAKTYRRVAYDPAKTYAISNSKLIPKDSLGWCSDYTNRYLNNVQIDHDGDGIPEPINVNDRRAYVMSWDSSIAMMIEHNPAMQYLFVEHTAENMSPVGSTPQDWRHHLTAVTTDGSYRRIIDNANAPLTKPYTAKGADLGSPCPPLCGELITFLKQGNSPRPACQ